MMLKISHEVFALFPWAIHESVIGNWCALTLTLIEAFLIPQTITNMVSAAKTFMNLQK